MLKQALSIFVYTGCSAISWSSGCVSKGKNRIFEAFVYEEVEFENLSSVLEFKFLILDVTGKNNNRQKVTLRAKINKKNVQWNFFRFRVWRFIRYKIIFQSLSSFILNEKNFILLFFIKYSRCDHSQPV